MSDFNVDESQDLLRMQKMRMAGYYESEGSVPMPEIVADGEGLDDGWLPSYAKSMLPPWLLNMGYQQIEEKVAFFQKATESWGVLDQVLAEVEADLMSPSPPALPTFCTDCGAMLRCTVCEGTGPGEYCPICGQKEDVRGDCPDSDA